MATKADDKNGKEEEVVVVVLERGEGRWSGHCERERDLRSVEQQQKQPDWLNQTKKIMNETSKKQKNNEEEDVEQVMMMRCVGMQ